jgi:hypothetical protein
LKVLLNGLEAPLTAVSPLLNCPKGLPAGTENNPPTTGLNGLGDASAEKTLPEGATAPEDVAELPKSPENGPAPVPSGGFEKSTPEEVDIACPNIPDVVEVLDTSALDTPPTALVEPPPNVRELDELPNVGKDDVPLPNPPNATFCTGLFPIADTPFVGGKLLAETG